MWDRCAYWRKPASSAKEHCAAAPSRTALSSTRCCTPRCGNQFRVSGFEKRLPARGTSCSGRATKSSFMARYCSLRGRSRLTDKGASGAPFERPKCGRLTLAAFPLSFHVLFQLAFFLQRHQVVEQWILGCRIELLNRAIGAQGARQSRRLDGRLVLDLRMLQLEGRLRIKHLHPQLIGIGVVHLVERLERLELFAADVHCED